MKICPTCQPTYSVEGEFCPRDGARLVPQATETEAQLAAGLSRRFRIVRRLSAGGMGAVFLAEQIAVGNRPVALKVLNRKPLDDPDFLLRFQNKATSRGRIHHPNVVTIYESSQANDGTPYIAMEFGRAGQSGPVPQDVTRAETARANAGQRLLKVEGVVVYKRASQRELVLHEIQAAELEGLIALPKDRDLGRPLQTLQSR
jgi:hypothetical protein